jgi:ATP-dependent Clp protease ATP-binding subunit ClpA
MNISELSKDAKEALIAAQDIALSKRHTEVMPEHLLLAVLRKRSGPVESLLSYLDKNLVLLQSIVEMDMEGFPKSDMARLKLPMSPLIEDLISSADLERDNFKSPKIGCEHILLALLDSGSSISPELIAKMGISKGELYRALGEMPEEMQPSAGISDELMTVAGTSNYCRDLTALARAGKLDPAIGYEDKIIEILQILVRRHRSNPILVGPDGVGKSALFRGFAQRMVDGNLLGEMKAKKLLLLDIDEITSGIKYRGELEERLRTVLNGIKESSKSTILAIDDIQELLTTSPTGGPPEMVGPLKAFLGRGEVTVIASTNEEDFTRHFSLDKGLAALFQRVNIQPPTIARALEIINGIKAGYEQHHGLKITDEAIADSVKMSKRYLGGRMLPDVAIDVLDEAASLFRLVSENLKSRLQNALRQIEGGDGKDPATNLLELKEIYENCSYRPEIKSRKILIPDEPKSNSDLAEPARMIFEALNSIEKKVTADDVARTVSRWTGIPLAKMKEDEVQKVLHMEEHLTKRVVGQDEAVRIISEAVRKARAGLKRPNRPIGAFIFLGPTGTGKTELAKAIAEFLFDDEKNIVRLDMSEYMEKHNVAKLIGAPPGYVGYEDRVSKTAAIFRSSI